MCVFQEPEDSDEKPSKIRKLPTPDESLSLDAEGFNLGGEENASSQYLLFTIIL